MRLLPFVLAAAGLHVLLPVMARIAPRPAAPLIARSTGLGSVVELDVEPPPPDLPREFPPVIPPESTPPPPPDPVRAPVPNAHVDSRPSDTTPTTTPEPVLTAAPTAAPAPTDEYGAPPPVEGPGGIAGLPPGLGTPVWAIPGVLPDAPRAAPAPTTAGPAPTVDRAIAGRLLAETMREKDKQLGLDLPGAGKCATIISEVVRGSTAPDVSRASLEVRIAPGGTVSSVRVVSSNGGSAGDWAAVASAAKSRLASEVFTLPSAYAAGAIVSVEVVSKVQYPDGSPAGGFQRGGPPPGSFGGGISFDTANIGARPKRHVRAVASARPAK